MSEQRPPERPRGPEEKDLDIPPIVGEVVQKTSRFSREVVATMISLATAAFGFVAALAWNEAITRLFTEIFKKKATEIGALFTYAVVVTLIGVVVIVLLGRLATRLRTEPIDFKYPGIPNR